MLKEKTVLSTSNSISNETIFKKIKAKINEDEIHFFQTNTERIVTRRPELQEILKEVL